MAQPGRPKGSVETPETILNRELKKNQELMDQVRGRLKQLIETTQEPEVLAKIIDALSKANATTLKVIETSRREEESRMEEGMTDEAFIKLLGRSE